MHTAVVITTIQPPTPSVLRLHAVSQQTGCHLIVVGDSKGPKTFHLDGVKFLSIDEQQHLGFRLVNQLPTGHYARKNIGYLEAIKSQPACIYETDDDNAPFDDWDVGSRLRSTARLVTCGTKKSSWVNTYRYFSDEFVWPRGFPLDAIHDTCPDTRTILAGTVSSPIQQGLVNGAPDVDAFWRLAFDKPLHFYDREPVVLASGCWCPFNTQNTWWFAEAYPLMYIPSYCPFRMCDIWKSLIAQRCLWAMDRHISFFAPDVYQDRNVHNIMDDFKDEIPGYLQNKHIAEILTCLNLDNTEKATSGNLRACYVALIEAGIFPARELDLVDLWINDLRTILAQNNHHA